MLQDTAKSFLRNRSFRRGTFFFAAPSIWVDALCIPLTVCSTFDIVLCALSRRSTGVRTIFLLRLYSCNNYCYNEYTTTWRHSDPADTCEDLRASISFTRPDWLARRQTGRSPGGPLFHEVYQTPGRRTCPDVVIFRWIITSKIGTRIVVTRCVC